MDWLIKALEVARSVKDSVDNHPQQSFDGRSSSNAPSTSIQIEAIGVIQEQGQKRVPKPKSEDASTSTGTKESSQSRESIRVDQNNESRTPRRTKHRFAPRKLDRDAVDVVRRLRRHDYAGYLVGGCVRDLYLGLSPKDFDVSTSARPEQIKKIFRNSRIIGRRFRLAHIYFRGGKIIETATFRGNASVLTDSEEAETDLLITRDNVWGTEEEDALRRDFTINGLMYDTSSGEIIDYVGGIEDLDGRKIRTIGDADIRLREDPVRILRAVRFAAKLDFELDADLDAAMRKHGDELKRCAQARILEETFKLFRTGSGANCVNILLATNTLHAILPQLTDYLNDSKAPRESNQHDELFAYLRALDALVQKRGQVSDAVILTSLLYLPLQDLLNELEPKFHGTQLNSIILELTRNMVLTRRMRERARQIILAQKHLRKTQTGKKPRRRVSPKAMVKRSYFADALDFFEIWSRKNDSQFDQVQVWRARAGEWDEEPPNLAQREPIKEKPAPRRRRRRRGRSPNRKNAGQSGGKPTETS